MTLEQMVTDLANSKLVDENDWYRWNEITQTKLPKGASLPAGNQYAKNVVLKLELHRLWLISDIDQRLALAKFYVSTWGGVKKNKDETLRGYVTQEPNSVVRNGKKGVASWSKVLCIRDPKRYAIFDARVSTALNCLQIIGETERPSLFPLLPGQNKRITAGAMKIKGHAAQHRRGKAKDLEYYGDYIDLIRNVAQSCQVPDTQIYTIEMLLFAQAEAVLSRAFPNAPSGKLTGFGGAPSALPSVCH